MTDELNIDYLELPASSLDAVQSFYQSVFAWTFEDFGPDYRAFSSSKLDGGFYRSSKVSSADQGAPLIVFYTNDIDGAQQRIIDAGGVIVKPIFEFPGGRRFQFTDPHGNELAVWTRS